MSSRTYVRLSCVHIRTSALVCQRLPSRAVQVMSSLQRMQSRRKLAAMKKAESEALSALEESAEAALRHAVRCVVCMRRACQLLVVAPCRPAVVSLPVSRSLATEENAKRRRLNELQREVHEELLRWDGDVQRSIQGLDAHSSVVQKVCSVCSQTRWLRLTVTCTVRGWSAAC